MRRHFFVLCVILALVWFSIEKWDLNKMYNTIVLSEGISASKDHRRGAEANAKLPATAAAAAADVATAAKSPPPPSVTAQNTAPLCADLQATDELASDLSQCTAIISLAAFESPAHILLLVQNALATASTRRPLVVIHLNRANYRGATATSTGWPTVGGKMAFQF